MTKTVRINGHGCSLVLRVVMPSPPRESLFRLIPPPRKRPKGIHRPARRKRGEVGIMRAASAQSLIRQAARTTDLMERAALIWESTRV